MQNFKVQHQTPKEVKTSFRLLQPIIQYRQQVDNKFKNEHLRSICKGTNFILSLK